MSTSSINSKRRPPTHCQCGKPLARRVAWTNINPCRRFLNCRNSTNHGMPHCNSFYWIDPELPNEWSQTIFIGPLLPEVQVGFSDSLLEGSMPQREDNDTGEMNDFNLGNTARWKKGSGKTIIKELGERSYRV
nr:cysteine-rich receptor-like protein kinase 20 [Tanacetum cinerariifolium]